MNKKNNLKEAKIEKIEMTRKQLLKYVSNEMTTNFYYLIYVRAYIKDYYIKTHFILWFDAFDVQEYFGKESYTKQDIIEYLEENIFFTIESFVNSKYIEFENFCKRTIKRY